MGVSTFDKIKEYAALSEERREAYEAYLSYWDEGTLEDFEERYEGKYNSPEDFGDIYEEYGYFSAAALCRLIVPIFQELAAVAAMLH